MPAACLPVLRTHPCDPAAPSCRDRAAERRKGLSADFEGVPDDLVGLLEGKVRTGVLLPPLPPP